MTYVDCHCLIKFAYKIFISKKRRDKVFFPQENVDEMCTLESTYFLIYVHLQFERSMHHRDLVSCNQRSIN